VRVNDVEWTVDSMSRKRRTLIPIAAALALVATATAAPSLAAKRGWTPGPEKYGDVVVQNVHIRMSDGVDLVGDVEYPADKATGNAATGRFPVLLTQNPYVCEVPASGSNTYYVDRGYIFATVCVRGAGRSGGQFGFMSRRDQLDGVELVNWAAHQIPGSNGVVGLTGCSYLGLTQIFTAGALPANSPVKEIRAVGLPILSPKVDIANVRVEFESGCVANFTASRVSTERVRKLRFFQPRQYVSIDYSRQDVVMFTVEPGGASPGFPQIGMTKPSVVQEEPLRAELRSFLDAVSKRAVPAVTLEDGRRALALALEIVAETQRHSTRAGLAQLAGLP